MRKWLKDHDISLRILSLFLAFLLWFYVVGQEDPTKSTDLRDVPVELIGLESLMSGHNLILIDDEIPTVYVRVSGAVSKLDINASDVTVRADVSHVEKAGEYRIPYDISVPNGLTVANSNPSAITLHFGDLVERELPVEVVIGGNVREGYVPMEPELAQSTVTVTGLAEEMALASVARVTVDASILNRNYEGNVRYEVVDAAGTVIDSDTITHVDRYVWVKIPVQMQKLVELKVDMIDGKGATSDDAVVDIEPSAIWVQGEIADVKELNSLSLAEVDLGNVMDSYSRNLPIVIPAGLQLISEENHANVRISFQGLTTLTFRTNDIKLINVPEGYTAKLREEELAVTVRGPSDMVAGLVSGDVSLQVDMSGRTLYNSGSLQIPATVVLSRNVQDLGVFNTYTVQVDYELVDTPADPDAPAA